MGSTLRVAIVEHYMIDQKIVVQVSKIVQVSALIKEFELSLIDVPENKQSFTTLPSFSPGSHIKVHIPCAKPVINAYSLMNDPDNYQSYRIAVRKEENSRGGSQYLHESIVVGDQLEITQPENYFPLFKRASKHLFIAGGIGITPFISYIPELVRENCDFELHYLYRGESGAYQNELNQQLTSRYFSYDSSQNNRCEIRELLASQTLGTHIYVCGPQRLLEEIIQTAKQLNIPDDCIHSEAFSVINAGKMFEVELSTTGQKFSVDETQSILEVLEDEGVYVSSSCRAGVCGMCECGVIEGEIDHRDGFLTDEERSEGNKIMLCVSRSKSKLLKLDL